MTIVLKPEIRKRHHRRKCLVGLFPPELRENLLTLPGFEEKLSMAKSLSPFTTRLRMA